LMFGSEGRFFIYKEVCLGFRFNFLKKIKRLDQVA